MYGIAERTECGIKKINKIKRKYYSFKNIDSNAKIAKRKTSKRGENE